MTELLKIACIGEAMIELSFKDGAPQLGFAGDVLNTSIYLRRNLSLQHEVAFVSVVGDDPYSQQMIDYIADENISTADIRKKANALPGLYAINTDEDGERSFHYWRDSSAARSIFEDGFEQLNSYDVLYFSGITLAIMEANIRSNFLRWVSNSKKTICFDSNFRPALWSNKSEAAAAIETAWKLTDIGFPSVDDEQALFGDNTQKDVLNRIRNWGVSQGAMKRGAEGPLPLSQSSFINPAYNRAAQVVDSTAAGDSFNGAFLANYLKDSDVGKAMFEAHECALRVISYPGAIIPKNE